MEGDLAFVVLVGGVPRGTGHDQEIVAAANVDTETLVWADIDLKRRYYGMPN